VHDTRSRGEKTMPHRSDAYDGVNDTRKRPFRLYEGEKTMPNRSDAYDGVNDTRKRGEKTMPNRSDAYDGVNDTRKRPFQLYEGEKTMPNRSDAYDGVNDTRPVDVVADKDGAVHVFVIGDWGAPVHLDEEQIAAGHCEHCTWTQPWWPDWGYDRDAQKKVAAAMKDRAAWANPQYVLNVGDNLYVQGLDHSCDAPPNDN
jgi:hypothetical protein